LRKRIREKRVVFIVMFRCVSMAFAHILFFAVMAMFLFPQSEVLYDQFLENWIFVFLSRLERIAKEAPTSPVYMIPSFNYLCFTRQQTIRMWWYQVIPIFIQFEMILLVFLAYSDNRLNVLFFIVFVIIGKMYDDW
jgi:hypothetical protein